jgi:Xaa-Pro dipeptidase
MAARIGQELPFTEAEHERRIARARAAMAEAGIDAALLFDPENIFYLTGYQSIGYFTFQAMLIPPRGKPVLISRVVNKYMAAITPTLGDFVEIVDTADPVEVTLGAIADHTAGGVLGLEMAAWYMTANVYEAIKARAGREICDWSGVIESHRVIKSPEELDRMRQAARACEAGMHAALEATRVGASENDIAAEMHRASIAAGSEYLGHAPLAVSGERSAVCFAMWRRRVLEAGDCVLLENGACIDRYHALQARVAVLGEPSDEIKRVSDAILAGLNALLETVRAGITSGEADAACRREIAKAGFGDRFVHRVAYSVGIGFPPNWSEGKTLSLRPDDPTPLQAGMTFHSVPSIFGGDFGMVFSETFHVTETGCEVLTEFPRKLLVQ